MSRPPPTALQALWLHRMRHDLPAAAARHPEWPIRRDHCFGRVILDAVCGASWRKVLPAPAWLHLTCDQLRRAVSLADAILAGDADLEALNRASLDMRLKRAPRRASGLLASI